MSRSNWTRRDFLRAGGLGAASFAVGGCTGLSDRLSNKDSVKKPNIIFVHTDSWDGRVLGCLGHPAMKRATPNIDRLARRGVVFRNTYCSHPICCPSRANMWSGTYTFRCESWNNYKGLPEGVDTVLRRLRDAGYRFASEKGGFGKHDHISGGHSQLARVTAWTGPADIRLPVYRMKAPKVLEGDIERVSARDWDDVDKAKAFLAGRAGDKEPFFLYVGIRAPHPAFTTSRRWLNMVDKDAVTIPPEDTELHPVMEYQRITKNWMHGFSREMVHKTRSIYYAMCAEADAMVGELLGEMDRLELAEDTYFIFSSDHGENNLEHRQFYKMNMYESSVRVPLVIAGPGVRRGVVVDNIVSLIDIYPTLMDMAGQACPAVLDGESLMGLLRGTDDNSRNWAFAMFTGSSSNTTMFMLRKGDWKYVAYPGYRPQLFNVCSDPDEIHELSGAEPRIVKQLDAELRQIVDYEEVHRQCIEYDKESFVEWRRQITAKPIHLKEYGADIENATYEQIMSNCYMGFKPQHQAKLEKWLNEK